MSFKCSTSAKYVCALCVVFVHTHTIQRISKTNKKLPPTQEKKKKTWKILPM